MFQFRHEKGDKKGARDAAHSHYGVRFTIAVQFLTIQIVHHSK